MMKKVFLLICVLCCASSAVAQDTACSLAKSAIQAASKIRNLKQKHEVPCVLRDKESVKKHLLEMVHAKIPKQKFELEGLVYKAVGFLPEDYDYEKGLIDLYVSQLGGYYDPEQDYFVMAKWMPEAFQTAIAVHELTHALQDQYYDLDAFMDPKIESSDLLLARSALVEGDATLVMLDYARSLAGQPPIQNEAGVEGVMFQNVLGSALTATAAGVPESLQLSLIFPYTSGLRFAHYLAKGVGYSAIDKAFKNNPRSTEEILHPEKYGKETPDFITISDSEVDGEGVTGIYHDTYGEFLISAMLGMHEKDRMKVAKAAAGWGGDRMTVIDSGDKRIIRWMLNWDTDDDAREFMELYEPVLKKKYSNEQLLLSVNGKRHTIQITR